jgi:hypothetical protein
MEFSHDGPPLQDEEGLLEALNELPEAEVEADEDVIAVSVKAKTPKGTIAVVPDEDLMPLVVSEAQEDVLAVLDEHAGDRSFAIEAVEIVSKEAEARRATGPQPEARADS